MDIGLLKEKRFVFVVVRRKESKNNNYKEV